MEINDFRIQKLQLVRDNPKLPNDVERHQNLKEEVDGSMPDYEISCLCDENLLGGQLPLVL